MPKLKQPSSLQKQAFTALLEIVVQFFDRLSVRRSTVEEFRQGISLVRETICSRIPWPDVAEFCTTFVKEFTFRSHPKHYCVAALEILMDTEIHGLRCDHNILRYLRPQDSHRLQGIIELNLNFSGWTDVFAKCDLNLKDLQIFVFSSGCSDRHLRVIGQNCSKLRVLKIGWSEITNKGLSALRSCSELRVVDIFGCKKVSRSGVVHLFFSHEKLEELSYGNPENGKPGEVHFLSRPDGQFLSLQHLHVYVKNVTDVQLQSTLAHFPNLTKFHLQSRLEECGPPFYMGGVDKTLPVLEKLFTSIGTIITSLTFNVYEADPAGMNLIYRFCPNIEYLKLHHADDELVVPPFSKLETLYLFDDPEDSPCTVLLSKISQLPKLKNLALYGFQISLETVVAMMLDDNKFPELALLAVDRFEEFDEVMNIARINNLDFRFCRFMSDIKS